MSAKELERDRGAGEWLIETVHGSYLAYGPLEYKGCWHCLNRLYDCPLVSCIHSSLQAG